MTYPEEERDNEYEGMTVAREASARETESVQEAEDEGEADVD